MSTNLEETDRTLVVTPILEKHNIPCCCVAVSDLKILRRQSDQKTWEICGPADLIAEADELFRCDNSFACLEPCPPAPASLVHTYRRFGSPRSSHKFLIIPDDDVHLDCRNDDNVGSLRGLPYPSLKVFAQSCIYRRNHLELSDLIDGSNVSEDWGEENLDLEGVHDVGWVRTMRAKEGISSPSIWLTRPKSRREIWQALVRTKDERLDGSQPPSRYITQYRHIGSKDPWTQVSGIS